MMLKEKAQKLLIILTTMIEALDLYERGENVRAQRFCKRLKPHIEAYTRAIDSDKDRDAALKEIRYMHSIMIEINHAQSKGDFSVVPALLFNNYFDLYTIFQDRRYINEQL